MANRGELYSVRMDGESGRRYYFFNVKVDRHGAMFMTIAESTKRPGGGFIRNEIFLYEEDVARFGSTMSDAIRQFKEIARSRGGSGGERDRSGADGNPSGEYDR